MINIPKENWTQEVHPKNRSPTPKRAILVGDVPSFVVWKSMREFENEYQIKAVRMFLRTAKGALFLISGVSKSGLFVRNGISLQTDDVVQTRLPPKLLKETAGELKFHIGRAFNQFNTKEGVKDEKKRGVKQERKIVSEATKKVLDVAEADAVKNLHSLVIQTHRKTIDTASREFKDRVRKVQEEHRKDTRPPTDRQPAFSELHGTRVYMWYREPAYLVREFAMLIFFNLPPGIEVSDDSFQSWFGIAMAQAKNLRGQGYRDDDIKRLGFFPPTKDGHNISLKLWVMPISWAYENLHAWTEYFTGRGTWFDMFEGRPEFRNETRQRMKLDLGIRDEKSGEITGKMEHAGVPTGEEYDRVKKLAEEKGGEYKEQLQEWKRRLDNKFDWMKSGTDRVNIDHIFRIKRGAFRVKTRKNNYVVGMDAGWGRFLPLSECGDPNRAKRLCESLNMSVSQDIRCNPSTKHMMKVARNLRNKGFDVIVRKKSMTITPIEHTNTSVHGILEMLFPRQNIARTRDGDQVFMRANRTVKSSMGDVKMNKTGLPTKDVVRFLKHEAGLIPSIRNDSFIVGQASPGQVVMGRRFKEVSLLLQHSESGDVLAIGDVSSSTAHEMIRQWVRGLHSEVNPRKGFITGMKEKMGKLFVGKGCVGYDDLALRFAKNYVRMADNPGSRRPTKLHTTANFYRERLVHPSKFDKRSFRTLKTKTGHRIIIGCLKPFWSPRLKVCKKGMRAQSILHPKTRQERQKLKKQGYWFVGETRKNFSLTGGLLTEKDEEKAKQVLAGAAMGAAAGSVIPGPGTAVGAAMGALSALTAQASKPNPVVKGVKMSRRELLGFVEYLTDRRVQRFTKQDVLNWLEHGSSIHQTNPHRGRKTTYKDLVRKYGVRKAAQIWRRQK